MRQTWFRRLLGLFLSPCFALAMWSAGGIHECPVHGGHGSPAQHAVAADAPHSMVHATSGAMVSATMTAQAMASHTMPHAATSETTAPPTDPGSHTCSCIGCCCVANGPAPVGSTRLIAVQVIDAPQLPAEVIAVRLPERIEHALPLSTAPPSALS